MASIRDGFEYDIFISYRHNDNKYDNWVTDFVEKLQQELDATLKDKLSIFFDRNPQEGLSETHNVDLSINNKIKSLIFIPIVSQTYCDTSSFAWNYEFKVFRKESAEDRLGENIRLTNGNIASRIIPVRIHELDREDIRLLENELSGALRSIDFVYRDAGVNRPLRHVDDEIASGPGTPLFRNQINKVANAIKELVQGIKEKESPSAPPPETVENTSERAAQIKPSSFSTSLPKSIKVQVIDRKSENIFLAWTSADLRDQRDEMALILKKAGFNVLPAIDCPADDEAFKLQVKENLEKCSCSLHILSGEFGRRFELEEEMSFPWFQFEEAKKKGEVSEGDFNTFIWLHPEMSSDIKPAQESFIRHIRNNITKNMMFSNSPGPMQLVDDIRAITIKEDEQVYDSKDTDIFFIFNAQDEAEAAEITDSLSNEFPIEVMNILPDGEDQYREMSSQQIPKSKLAVVYFKYAADWALPFIKQIWKKVGGASSPTPMFLVGEDDPKSNMARIFKAPKVVSNVVPKKEIPAEVKKVYTTVINLK